VVRGPGVLEGAENSRLVLNNDLAPTFAALAGISMRSADGRSILPLLKGESPPWRNAFLLENQKDLRVSDVPTYKAVRTQDYLYVEYESGERELYDLANDPYQLENSYPGADPAFLRKMHNRLEALKGCTEEACRTAENGPAP
jgi:N-acetylglucosamine-6-sulfatase